MYSRVTVTADELQVIPIERYVWIIHVVCVEYNLVMDDFSAFVYSL